MKAVIIEDEALIARELKRKIEIVDEEIEIVKILPSVFTARKWFMENALPDLIFADIQLSDGTSFEIFEKFELTCPVVFTTAYDEYAIKAFKVNGVDYLLKPIDDDELRGAVQKAKAIAGSGADYPMDLKQLVDLVSGKADLKDSYKEQFIIKSRNQWIPVPVKEIACFFRDSLNYIYTFQGQKYILDFTSLDDIEETLNPRYFYRANRQCILHIDAIKSYQVLENQKLVLTLHQPLNLEVDISREKAPQFKKWLDR